jgi:hypothetical protein
MNVHQITVTIPEIGASSRFDFIRARGGSHDRIGFIAGNDSVGFFLRKEVLGITHRLENIEISF